MDERVRIDLINEQCFKITVNEYDQELLEIDLSNWHDLVEESILKEHALNAKMISFKLDDVGILRTELCEWISEYIAPKIVELSITSCHQFSWKYLKTLLENAYSVGSICLQKNHWVNDDVVEQLSRKYSKTLQYFDLEYTKITDNSLFHLGQRCLKLRSIRLDCCPKVTNAGLIELSRRIHLISIHICHNMNITDRSIETLLSQSSELSSLKLTNCPNLTDKSMEVLHEVVVSWGKTRNTKSKLLTIVEFRDNENISSMGVLMLANSAVSLVSLDLRDCSNIDWLEGLEHLSYMKNLKYLKIGPTTPRTRIRNTVQAVKYLSVHSSRLLTLHLNGITEFSDEDIADILENADIMEELSVSNMRFGTNAVESLCSNNPNISRLSVCGSEIFQDIDLRCVCTVCLHLVELTVQRCPLLTDGGFSRCAILRRLQKLDVTDCSSNMSGTLFGCFGLCPLQTLVVGSLHRICPKRDFERFSPLTVNSVRMISIRNCDNVNTEDISFILSQFLNCLELDFTGCRQLVKADVLMKIKHTHPFLNLVIDGVPVHRKFSVPIEHSTNYGGDTVASLLDARGRSVVVASQTVGVVAGSASVGNTPLKKKRKRKGTKDAPPTPTNTTLAAVPVDGPEFLEAPRGFYGFKAFAVERMKHQQYVAVVSGYKKLHAVNVISGQYKVHLEHKKAYAEEGKKKFALLQVVMATKIKAKYRMVLQRRKAKHALYCATVITLAARRYLYVYRVGIRFRKAARYHRKKVQKKYFDVIVGLVTATREFLLERAAQLNPLMARRLQRTTLRKFRAFQSELIEDKYDKAAEVVWEANIKVTLIAKWKELIGISTAKNLKLNKIFMNCVGIETMNSMRQKSDRDRAEMFFTRRIILPAWVAFCDDYLRAQRAAKKEPMAIEHFRLSFAARVTALCFKAVNDYRKYRQWRKGLIVTAEEQYLRHKLQLGVKFLKARREYRLYHRGQHIKAMVSTRKFWKKVTLKNRLPFVTKVRRYTDKIYKYVDQYRREYLVEIGFQDLKNSCLMLRNFRIMNAIAEQFLHNKTKVKVFRGWKKYHIFVKNINQFVKDHYQGGLMRRAIYGLRHNWAGAKAYKLELQRKLEQKIKSEEEYLILTKGAIKLQAVVRGANIREWAIDKRTTQMYSIRIIQGFVRRGLALRAYRRKTRAVKLALVKSEEAELDLMRIAEAETKYYEYHMSAATMIQRNFRGFSSREITNVMAIERTKGRGMDFYEAAAKMRARHENFKRAELAKQKAREKAIAKIQARVRGMIQRKKFDEIKYQGKVAKYAFLCQTWYRGKLARMKLAALRRDKVGELRFKAARRQRGMLLRMLGFWNRKSQNRFASVIGALGLDPITFNYRLNELWADVVKDYYVFINTIKREKELYDEHKGNRLLMTNGRRKILSNAGWTLKINDAVRIVDEEHKFYGYTGIVVRIDTDIPGLPLFEVKLDGLPRQTFAMMTTDALVAYDQQQVLARIEKFPVLEGFEQPFVMYGLDPEDPFFAENAVDAAWTIQRGWRCHRARNIVARKRYEMWTRASHNQWALYDHLADSNVISAQAYNITGWAGLRYKKKIRFDALRHTAIPIRLITNRNLVPEAPAIRQEFEIKYRQRIHYLERSAITQDREFFHIGYERMTTMRKMALCTRVIWGFIRQGGSNIKDMVGRKGARYLAKQKNLVTGADHFAFPQMQGSPHVRYSKTIIYHGEWSGIPLFTPLVPHGEGMVIFLEGWGFAREDKVLYLTIIRCTRLMMMDLTSSDPFCDIFCNAKNLQTSVKYGQMNPEFHERFEIDVTNPSATVKIVVKDKDFLSDDDFMGQVELKLNDFRDGKEHHLTETLRDEFGEFEDDNDRGDIEFKIQWTDRVFTDDVQKQARRVRATIQLQAWIRRINAKVVLKGLRRERIELLEMVREKAVLMCCVVRRRLAYKVAKRLKRRLRACIKLQKRMRIYLAKKCVRNRRGNWEKAIILQSFIRGILGKAVLRRLREKRIQLLQSSATCMQKWVRRLICRCREARRRDMGIIEAGAGYVAPVRQPVSEWIDTYGTDPDYGLRRTKRVYENTFSRMLKKKYCRIKSKYGFVFVDQYPPQELDKYDDEDLCIRDDFVAVFLPSMEPRLLHLEVAIASIQRAPHNAIMHLPSAISVRGSVDMVTTQIQCAVRQMFANKYYKKLLKVRIAVILLQRAFRKRFEKLHSASLRISAFFRLIIANRVTQVRRIEINSAKLIQCGVRCWIARSRKFDLMCIRRASILKFSSAIPDHGPEKLLDFKSHTYWLSDSPERAEVRIELKKRQAVEEIWVMTCTRQASAQSVTISVVTDKRTMKYDTLYHDITLPLQNGRQWRKFPFNAITAKFFKLSFGYNYGDEDHIGVRQIRFVKAKEKSAKFVEQPQHHIFRDDGPTIGKSARVILKAGIDGWPYPSIQWYRNGVAIPNANKPELVLNVKCELYKTYRTYRCTKCKMVSNQVPENCYHIICGNCNHKFDYKEAEQLDQAIAVIHEKERIELKELEAYNTSRQEMITSSDPKLRNMVPQIEQNIAETEQRLQILKERRNVMKKSMEFANIYRDEGLYECHIENTRGGNIVISKKSRPAVVFVEHSERYKVKVRPVYIQRAQVLRKNWTIYSSIMGTFVRGKVSGLVVVRYNDNSYYEGPYIGEEWLDGMGKVNDLGRTANHYGVYKCFDGRIFEGINVDNHFDPHNLQSFYRLTLPNGEVYEGMFCDEMYHGVGMYVYKDGSVYEGNWHKGSRFGHGHYRASASNPDGMWTYEGDWDTDRRHGEGMINFADGSCYIGEWFYEARQGMGVFISRLRDVYKGEFRDNKFHGHGELVYSDGSKYVGGFKDGMRQGRGIFSEKSGREFYGHFVDDKLNGEAIVKNIIPIETLEQDNFEVRVALYEMGDFKTWKSKYSNPMATRQFVKLFKSNREMFDSVYSMIVAKSLPDIPHGLDDRNEDVLLILEKIRSEAGQLVGQEVLEKAQKRLDDLMIPLKELKEEVAQLKDELDALSVSTVELEQSKTILTRDYKKLMREVEAERMKIEQYWHDDPTESRRKFRDACKQLSKVTKDEYFLFKNHRVPPPFVRKILDAICILLNMDIDSWKKQQMIVSDAVFNARMADDAALRYDYSCKLDHMMNHKTSTYDVFDYIGVFKSPHYDHLINILTDPRFRKDSYYVESCGVAAPFLVEWVYCNVAYLRAGRLVQDLLERSRKNFISASRMLKNHQFKDEQQASVLARIKIARQEYTKKKLDLSDLEEAVVKAKDMIRFVTESYNFGNKRKVVLDYYEQLEKKMEAEKDQLDVESALEALKKGVIDEHEFLIKERAKEARARGEAYSPPAIVAPQLMHDIMEEVTFQQDAIISDGECVGYTLEPVPNTISPERTKQITKQICEMIMGLMNSTFHEIPINRRWVSMKGKVLTPRFLYIIIWKIWKDIATERENAKAIAGWEEIFGPDPRACAVMAIQARVNWRMSEVARKQSKIWALKYPKEVELAEQQLSEEFSELFTTDIAAQAMEISEDETGVHGPEIKSQALCWIKYHPSIFNKEKDSRAAKMAKEFQKTYSKNSASMAFKIINGLLGPDADEYKWHDHATHWVSFHRDGYDKDTAVIVANLAKKFADKHPAKTAIDAVTVIHNEEVSKYIVDPEVYKEYSQEPDQYFSARCWGLLNQGLLRGARETVTRERNATLKRMWNELEVATEEFRKGSYLYTPEEMKYTPSKDRFVGFRNRLSNKYGYLYGCLLMQANDLWKEMENLEVNDPLTKVAHNIRPSEAEQKERMEADNYIKEKNAAENAYNEVSSKLSIWNTYFGTEEEKQYYIDNPEPEAY